MPKTITLETILACVCINCLAAADQPSTTPQAESKRIVSKYKTVFNRPPKKTPCRTSVDGPLLGNGNLASVISGPPEAQRFWLCKNDFWRFKSHDGKGYVTGVGYIDIKIPDLKGAGYHIRQNLYDAKTSAVFTQKNAAVTIRSYIAAEHALLIIEIESTNRTMRGEIAMTPLEGGGSDSLTARENENPWIVRKFEKDVDMPSAVAAAAKLYVGGTGGTGGTKFELKPGKPVRLVVAMRSRFDGLDYLKDALRLVENVDFDAVDSAHCKWWRDFWSGSRVEVGDPRIERHYYLSNYVMGSCSRSPEFPPGLFGPWITVDRPGWHGDYHLNYNYQAPFYGLYSSNHIAQANTYHKPVLAFIERGKFYAKKELNCRGVYFPVGLGPKGLETAKYAKYGGNKGAGHFMGQKSNAAYCLVNIAFHWYSTYDRKYAGEVYPFVIEVANFWEDYLKWEGDSQRYIIQNDSIHELSGKDMNPILSLGLVRNAFTLAIDMSKELRLDARRQEKWKHILKHLSAFPTQIMKGKKVFRYSEKGKAWWRNNTLGIQHIYPGGAVGMDSDSELLEISRNTIEVMGRWIDGNGSNSFFPAAVRVGYDPKVIWTQLTRYVTTCTQPNGFTARNPHGVENCSIVPNTINMMLCSGHQGVLRVFGVWPKDRDARFGRLRAYGAFLVSSELKGGKVRYVNILSEKGRPCTLQNPWPGKKATLTRNGSAGPELLEGKRFTFKTAPDQRIEIKPAN